MLLPNAHFSDATNSRFDLNSLFIKEESLKSLRQQIYGSQSPGYFIIRNFLTPEQLRHIQEIWTEAEAPKFHQCFRDKRDFYFGCPNYYSEQNGSRTFYNFLWEKPLDELTYSIAIHFHMLRNRIEAKTISDDLFPYHRRSCSYRVIVSDFPEYEVKPPRDYYFPDDPTNKLHDLTRVQGTLFLSEYGRDYTGGGFVFRTNQGTDIQFGKDIQLAVGDFVIWRYSNLHSVTLTKRMDNGMGFVRILFPPEYIYERRRGFLDFGYRIARVACDRLAKFVALR